MSFACKTDGRVPCGSGDIISDGSRGVRSKRWRIQRRQGGSVSNGILAYAPYLTIYVSFEGASHLQLCVCIFIFYPYPVIFVWPVYTSLSLRGGLYRTSKAIWDFYGLALAAIAVIAPP